MLYLLACFSPSDDDEDKEQGACLLDCDTGSPGDTAAEVDEDTGEDTEEDTGADTEDTHDTADLPECRGHDPVLESIDVGEGEPTEDREGNTWPTIEFAMGLSDEDGNLDLIGYRLWIDEEADGDLDFRDDPTLESDFIDFGNEACEVPSISLNLRFYVDGEPLAPGTDYDLGLVIFDAAYEETEAALFTLTTPEALD